MAQKRAYLSVTDKTGIVNLARGLVELGYEIVSTGGTEKVIREAGVPVTPVEVVTGFPEMLGGRVKSLHPKIFGGILAVEANPEHTAQIEKHGIPPIDVVVCNLYDFARKPGIEQIDIGGPSLIRAAAKNCQSVSVLISPNDYERFLSELQTEGDILLVRREFLAYKAFRHTAEYDDMISSWMSQKMKDNQTFQDSAAMPAH